MPRLLSLNVATRLPLVFAVFSASISIILVMLALIEFQRFATSSVQNQMASLVADRRAAVQQLMGSIQSDLRTLVATRSTQDALAEFSSSWGELGTSPHQVLTQAYIDGNAHKTGEKHLLDRAEGDAKYHSVHGTYHAGFRTLIDTKGYYDAFLINPEGDIVYSVFKEVDFATNLTTGDYSSSGLGAAFRAAKAAKPGATVLSDMEPYAPSFGAAAAFIASPVHDSDGTLLGVAALQIPVALLGGITNNSAGLGETTVVYIVGDDKKARTTSRFENSFEVLDTLPGLSHIEMALDGQEHFFADATGLDGHPVLAYSRPLEFDGARWAIMVEQDRADVMAPVYKERNILILISIAVCVVMSFLGWRFALTITRPLGGICTGMEAVAAEDFDRDIPEARRSDEIGNIGRTLVDMGAKLKAAKQAEGERQALQAQQDEVVERISAGLDQLARGDFSHTIETAFGADHDRLRKNFNKTVSTLNDTMLGVVDAGDSIKTGTADINQSSDDLSQRTEAQAATLEQTAAALEEITASVRSAADGARSVEKITAEAKDEAQRSDAVVQNAVTAMTAIEQSSKQISQIISVIDDIAFQTNLLALNAGVEAARAGEAGRGFAVVASEVRALAQRSSDAAMEIKNLIGNSSQQVDDGVKLVGEAGSALSQIMDRVNTVAQLVSEIAEGAAEQSNGLAEINTGMTQLDQVTQQNAAMVEEASAACTLLNSDADKLNDIMRGFRLSRSRRRMASSNTSDGPSAATPAPSAAVSTDPELSPKAEKPEAAQNPPAVDGTAALKLWDDF